MSILNKHLVSNLLNANVRILRAVNALVCSTSGFQFGDENGKCAYLYQNPIIVVKIKSVKLLFTRKKKSSKISRRIQFYIRWI